MPMFLIIKYGSIMFYLLFILLIPFGFIGISIFLRELFDVIDSNAELERYCNIAFYIDKFILLCFICAGICLAILPIYFSIKYKNLWLVLIDIVVIPVVICGIKAIKDE